MTNEDRLKKKEGPLLEVTRRKFITGAGVTVAGGVVGAIAGAQLFPEKTAEAAQRPVPLLQKIPPSRYVKILEGPTLAPVPISTRKCTGCELCSIGCSYGHCGVYDPLEARIRVINKEVEFGLGEAVMSQEFPFPKQVCQHCPGISPCMEVCPKDAIYRDKKTGAVLVDNKKCVRCGTCVEACPYDAVWLNKKKNKIVKCNLCGGDPECVKWCPTMILSLTVRK